MKLKDTIKGLLGNSELREVFGMVGLLHRPVRGWPGLGMNEKMRLHQKLLLAQLGRIGNY